MLIAAILSGILYHYWLITPVLEYVTFNEWRAVAILAALGREEFAVHLRAAIHNIGVDPHEISEVLLHVAVYAGVPAANSAFAVAKREFDEDPAKVRQEEA